MTKPPKLVNLCPHEITIVDSKGKRIDIVSSGVARVTLYEKSMGFLGDIPIISCPRTGKLIGLPRPIDGIAYLVSHEVLEHPEVVGRSDVFSPATRQRHNPYRDEQGRVIGVCALISTPTEED